MQTDVHGSASIDIPLPDNLTTWNIWVIGHTEDNAFGEAESSFVSTLPLRITPEIPNVLRAGDVTQLGVQVHR